MAVITMRQMLEAGVHFGHQTRRWNPKMKRFIFGERNGIYIIDLDQTLTRVERAYGFVRDLVAEGGTLLFVGTKKQAQDPIRSYAEKCNMPFVNERWLGGMLTNFDTIAKRISKMLEYERMQASGELGQMPKKEALMLSRELQKLQRNLGGLRDLTRRRRMPSSCSTRSKEHIAVTEARTSWASPSSPWSTPTLIPRSCDYPIPGNDDAIRCEQPVRPGDRRRCRRRAAYIAAEAQRRGGTGRPVGRGGVAVRGRAGQLPVRDAAQAQAARDARLAARLRTAPPRWQHRLNAGTHVEASTVTEEAAAEADAGPTPASEVAQPKDDAVTAGEDAVRDH